MKIWILQTGEPLHCDEGNPRPMRAMNLANSLIKKGHSVVIWSTSFYHQEKLQRCFGYKSIFINNLLEIRLIPSPGYKKNIGVKRIIDHIFLAKNLKNILQKEVNLPDLAFIGYPPIEVSVVMSDWLKKRKIEYLLDIKDQWPTIFIDTIPRPLKFIGKIFLWPYYVLGRKVMNNASGIITMSESFLKWANMFSGSNGKKLDLVVPLTAPKDLFSDEEIKTAENWWDLLNVHSDHKPRVCFVGTHSRAFDMIPIYNAAKSFLNSGISCDFIICGSGPLTTKWKLIMKNLPNVIFTGWISMPQAYVLSKRSIASLAPYNNENNFINNIPNKVLDALSFGLPILSPLKGEVAKLIDENEIGLSYSYTPEKSLEQCIIKLINEPKFKNQLSENATILYFKTFSFEKVYESLTKHIENIVSSNY